MFIGDWMARGADYWPERIAVVDAAKNERFTYARMNARANRLAAWLKSHGVARADRVGLLAHNGVEYLDLLFACAKLGAVFVPFNWRLHPRELCELVTQTSLRVLFFASDFRAAADEISQLRAPPRRLCLESDYAPLVEMGDMSPIPNEAISETDTLCLLFTGGTTGTPKAARISYRMVAWNTLNTLVHEARQGDVTITHTPMFHTGGLLVYTLPLLTVGGTVVILRKWDANEMLAAIEREKPTLFFCVPTQYQQLLDAPAFATTDFSSLRFMTSGGAPLPVPLIRAFASKRVPFKQGFGMTEFGPGVFSMGPEFAETKAGSIGRPNYFVEARLVDGDNREVAVGELGELVLRGPTCFSGYFGQPAPSRDVIDEHGWFHTGDLARRDADGFFFIVDRKKDMFISGGENVFPVEIEAALHEHAAISQAAVVGVPDEKWGEVGCAFVVLKPGHDVTADALLAFLRERLARYKVPKRVELVSALPMSAAGKVLKPELKKLATRN